jgi:LuxR family transcriptional regulator, maltose regulon positive regulatory protein
VHGVSEQGRDRARAKAERSSRHPHARTEKTLRLRASRRDTASAAFWELSERELAVLRLLASKLSQREIAAELYVSFNTVKTHTRAIFRKLGVASRAEAVDRAR